METQTKLRNGLEWAGIILLVAAWLLLLEWPLTRPWLIGALVLLVIVRLGQSFYLLARGRIRLDQGFLEGFAASIGALCIAGNMMWDLSMLLFVGLIFMLGPAARRWYEQRPVSDSSGPIAN